MFLLRKITITVDISIHALLAESDGFGLGWMAPHAYFYPRSPCGERPPRGGSCYLDNIISIHALLAESDGATAEQRLNVEISIHALLAESDALLANLRGLYSISIHALLAESDCRFQCSQSVAIYFYPRSPCGERLHFFQLGV